MMSACLQPIQLAIDHVGSNREWVPIARNAVRERPDDPVQSETACYLFILVNICRVVVVDEIVRERLIKNEPRNRGQKNANTEKCESAATRLVIPGKHVVWALYLWADRVSSLR